jgi:hypothetical protein
MFVSVLCRWFSVLFLRNYLHICKSQQPLAFCSKFQMDVAAKKGFFWKCRKSERSIKRVSFFDVLRLQLFSPLLLFDVHGWLDICRRDRTFCKLVFNVIFLNVIIFADLRHPLTVFWASPTLSQVARYGYTSWPPIYCRVTGKGHLDNGVLSRWTYRHPFDHQSQATLGPVST